MGANGSRVPLCALLGPLATFAGSAVVACSAGSPTPLAPEYDTPTSGETAEAEGAPPRSALLPNGGAGSSGCPEGTVWDGRQCVGAVNEDCPAGTTYRAGQGCVANGSPQPSPSASPLTSTSTPAGMVRIPTGTFLMGSDFGDADEEPVHRVTVPAFEMDVTEVTVAQYTRCVDAAQCTEPDSGNFCNWASPGRDNHPINCVDWNHATTYCKWAGKRLPTEQEWEYAARGTDGRVFPWGDSDPASQLCWNRWRTKEGTCPSGASAFGLLDMAGNVYEWTSRRYCDSYAANRNCTDSRVNRGGGWSDEKPSYVRSSFRLGGNPTLRGNNLGFRCAR